MPIIDRLHSFILDRRALRRSKCARRDRRAAIRNDRDGRAKRAGAPVDALRGFNQRDDYEYDSACHQRGRNTARLDWLPQSRFSSDLEFGHAQARNEFAALFPLGVGFFGGTAIGAIAFLNVGLPCILAAVIPVGGLALWYARRSDLP